MIKKNTLSSTLILLLALILPSAVSALPEGYNQLRLQTGTPKKITDTAFSYLVSWRKADSNIHRANGLIFINGSDAKKSDTAIEVARKITKSINAGVAIQSPHDRGAIAKNSKNKTEVIVSNKANYDLAHITVRDYSNQQIHYNIPGKSFNSVSVDLAIDLVYSAAVEYVDGFSSSIKHKTAGGWIKVVIDNNPAIEIKTDDKTTTQLETELAHALGANAHFSSTPIYPNFVELRSKNYKVFDGGEVQLPLLNAKSISIDINDPGLGVLTKFDFPDVNKPTNVVGKVPYFLGFLIAAVLGFLYFLLRQKKH